MRIAIVLLAAACAAAEESPGIQLTRMRVAMNEALKSLPNYVCLQTTERLHSPKVKARLTLVDTVKLEVAHVGDKEMYSWPGRGMFADTELLKALPSGLVGSGTYASQLIDVLYGPETQFRWVGRETIGGRAALRWDFTVPRQASAWSVGEGRRTAQVGATGSVWADAGTLTVVRLEAQAAQFPARFPLKAVTRTIDYARVRIGARDLVLPAVAEDSVETARGELNINRSRFGQCREYSATSTLSFDQPAAPEAAPGPPAPAAAPAALPPDLRILLALDGHLRSQDAVMGAPVNAHVASDVRYAGAVLVPKGTPVRGVLRQYAKIADAGFTSSFSLTIEFTELALPAGTIPFRARLKSIDSPSEGLFWLVPTGSGRMRMEHSASQRSVEGEGPIPEVGLAAQDGVAVLVFIRQPSFHLSPGTRMTWMTGEDPPKP